MNMFYNLPTDLSLHCNFFNSSYINFTFLLDMGNRASFVSIYPKCFSLFHLGTLSCFGKLIIAIITLPGLL